MKMLTIGFLAIGATGLAFLIPACIATRNADGSYNVEFAPDMTITARGLEDALKKCLDLKEDCMAGTWERPCTQAESDDIQDTIDGILREKGRITERNSGGGTAGTTSAAGF